MSSSNSSEAQHSESEDDKTPEPKTLELRAPLQQFSDPPMNDPKTLETENGDQREEEEEEEEGECPFCLFMKGGGCRDSFIAWENCVEEVEKNNGDIVEKCFEVTGALKKCMEAHSDYYEPILQAEKAANEVALRELEKEKAEEAASSSASEGSEEPLSSRKEEESRGSEKQ